MPTPPQLRSFWFVRTSPTAVGSCNGRRAFRSLCTMPVDAFHDSCNYHMVSLLELSSNLHTAEMGPNRASRFRPCKASSE
eukprot:8527831-Alexandrium_andersonii.AAC.1